MRAARAVTIAVIVVVAVTIAALPGTAATAGAARTTAAPKPPAWVRRVIAEIPNIAQAQGSEDIEVHAAGTSTSVDNAFTFDRTAGYATSDVTTGNNLDEVLTVYVLGDTAWLDIADPSFSGKLPAGKRFVTVATKDLTSGLISTDPNTNLAPLYILLGATHVKFKPLEGAGHHVYDFDVDLAAARAAVPDAVRPGFLQAYGRIPSGKQTQVRGSATVDDSHHVLDFEVRFDVKIPAHRVRLTLDLSLENVNLSVDAVHPPDAQSVPIDSVPGLRDQLHTLIGNPVAAAT